MMALVFGEIPIHDALIVRFTTDAWRSRIYAIKYVITLGVSALAIPLIAFTHDSAGGLSTLFTLLAACVAIILVAVAFLPTADRAGAAASRPVRELSKARRHVWRSS